MSMMANKKLHFAPHHKQDEGRHICESLGCEPIVPEHYLYQNDDEGESKGMGWIERTRINQGYSPESLFEVLGDSGRQQELAERVIYLLNKFGDGINDD